MADDPTLTLTTWTGPWEEDDPDAAFKSEVAAFSHLDPMVTLEALAERVGIPAGALARAILARWSAAGSSGLLELGPSTVGRLAAIVDEAEAAGSESARLTAFDQLRGHISWLASGLDDPTAYPAHPG